MIVGTLCRCLLLCEIVSDTREEWFECALDVVLLLEVVPRMIEWWFGCVHCLFTAQCCSLDVRTIVCVRSQCPSIARHRFWGSRMMIWICSRWSLCFTVWNCSWDARMIVWTCFHCRLICLRWWSLWMDPGNWGVSFSTRILRQR